MSASRQTQRLKIGARVDASDGQCGQLTRVIIDPVGQALTDLVVTPRHDDERSRLVPVGMVEAVDDDLIRLRCTKQEFEHLDSAEEVQFLLQADTNPLGYGNGSASWAVYLSDAIRGPGPHEPMYSDRIPLGEVEIKRGEPAHAKDGPIGTVKGLVVDRTNQHVTHVLLREGHLWERRQVAIPIRSVSHIGSEMRIDLTKDEIAELPPVSFSSHH